MITSLPPTLPADHIAAVTHRFERDYNPIIRQEGWRPAGIPNFDPVPPAMCVHDLLEHFPELGSEVYAEYMALGCAHFIRGRGGYFKRQGVSISDALPAPAFGMLFHHIYHGNMPTEDCPMVAEAFLPIEPFRVDQVIQQTLINARAFLRNTYDAKLVDASLKQGLGWMRIGYRRAEEERYAGIDPRNLSKLFFQAQTRIERETAQSRNPQVLTLQLTPSTQTYRAHVL